MYAENAPDAKSNVVILNAPGIKEFGEVSDNALLYAVDFTQSEWAQIDSGNQATVSSNAAVAPDGNTTADEIEDGNTSAEEGIKQTASISTGLASIAFSIYIAKVTVDPGVYPRIRCTVSGSTTINYDAVLDHFSGEAGEVAATASSGSVTVEETDASWWRLKMVVPNTDANNNSVTINIYPAQYTDVTSGVASGYSTALTGSIRVWGAQVNSGTSVNGLTITSAVASTGTGAIRGRSVLNNVLYVASGRMLASVDSNGWPTAIGDLGNATNRASMASNGTQICIVDGVAGWIYTTGSGLVQISDGDFLVADTVTYQDGYFILSRKDTGDFFISALNDGTAYDATERAEAEGKPDDLVAVYSDHLELWLFGKESIEIWYNSGAVDFPFKRREGVFIERGCAAAFSIANEDNTLFWLGDDKIVYRANGYTPMQISTPAIEEQIRKLATVSDAIGTTFTIGGHKFYSLVFPTSGGTFVYDMSTKLWHERESLGFNYWRGQTSVFVYGKHLIGDSESGKIGELDLDTYQEYGSEIQALATAPVIHSDRKYLFFSRFELDIESGVGLSSGQGSDPKIVLDYSDDGGRTWSSRKPWRSMGKIGDNRQRLRWNRQGRSRNRVYRVVITDPVKRAIIAAHADVRVGTS